MNEDETHVSQIYLRPVVPLPDCRGLDRIPNGPLIRCPPPKEDKIRLQAQFMKLLKLTSRNTWTTSNRVPRHDASMIFPVTSISSAFISSSGISPLASIRSISCITCCTLKLRRKAASQSEVSPRNGMERTRCR